MSTRMRTRDQLVIVVVAACTASCGGLATTVTDVEHSTETSAVIFPDDSAPSESCDLNVSLACGGRHSWTLDHMIDFTTRARQTTSVGRTVAPSISAEAQSLLCTSTGDFVIPGVYVGGAVVGQNGYSFTADGKGILFNPRISSLQTVPPRGGAERDICALSCSPDGVRSGCNDGINTEYWDARLTGPGGVNKVVKLQGVVDRGRTSWDRGVLQMYCTLSLPKRQMVTVKRRPNDVIASGINRWIRGYELTGTALHDACYDIAARRCTPTDRSPTTTLFQTCTVPNAEACISDFRDNPDPCNATCFAPCASSAQCGTHAICTDGCCRANPA